MRLQCDSEDSNQLTDALADLSLRCAQMQSCRKCCAPAEIISSLAPSKDLFDNSTISRH